MITRQTPINVASESHYVRVELDSRPDDEIYLSLPLPSQGAEHLKWLAQVQMAADLDIKDAAKEDNEVAQWDSFSVMRQYYDAMQGYLIGLLWAHPTLELEAAQGTYPTEEERGKAVVAELYGYGYSLEEIAGLFQASYQVCLQRCLDSRWNNAKIARLVNFGKPTKEAGIGSSSVPVSNTTETPAPSSE
jgi:hypothetical protein